MAMTVILKLVWVWSGWLDLDSSPECISRKIKQGWILLWLITCLKLDQSSNKRVLKVQRLSACRRSRSTIWYATILASRSRSCLSKSTQSLWLEIKISFSFEDATNTEADIMVVYPEARVNTKDAIDHTKLKF